MIWCTLRATKESGPKLEQTEGDKPSPGWMYSELSCCPKELWEEVGNWGPSLPRPTQWVSKPTAVCMSCSGAWPNANILSLTMAVAPLPLSKSRKSFCCGQPEPELCREGNSRKHGFSLTTLTIKIHHNCCLAR